MRVKIIKQHKKYQVGQVVEVSPNVGFGLVDSGHAIVSRDFTAEDVTRAADKQRSRAKQRPAVEK